MLSHLQPLQVRGRFTPLGTRYLDLLAELIPSQLDNRAGWIGVGHQSVSVVLVVRRASGPRLLAFPGRFASRAPQLAGHPQQSVGSGPGRRCAALEAHAVVKAVQGIDHRR
jgi:hypothetical protein